MKAKRIRYCLAMLAVMGAFAAGCGSDVETEEEIITLKEEEEGGESTQQEQETPSEPVAGEREGIAGQVQAPEHYEADLSDGGIHVKVDADVYVPEGEGFKNYRVKGRPFGQADYEAVSSVLLNGEKLWERDMDAMAESGGFTREEIDRKIAQLEEGYVSAQAAGPEAEALYTAELGRDYGEAIIHFTEMREKALEEPVLVEVPAVITVDDGTDQTGNEASGVLSGNAAVEGSNYWLCVDNLFRKDWHWNTFRVIREDGETGYFGEFHTFLGADDEAAPPLSFSIDEAREAAKQSVEEMGFTDFVPAAEGYFAAYRQVDVFGNTETGRLGYGFHFTRTLDGIPVTYAGGNQGTSLEEGEEKVWPYENLTMVYNEDGLADFKWENPYEVEKVSDEYLFLLPFSEIQNIFDEMMLKKYQDWVGDSDMQMDFQIDEVRLGYMRIREKGNIEEGTMVPVWDFFGTRRNTYGEEEFYDDNSAFSSWFTINALDGTIIDRGFGY
ncbi:MAG: DUF6034 family protein [Lachnospiraceae bacterium]|nr:DUF6034 family protein [Lachnospiraceae bacterium]